MKYLKPLNEWRQQLELPFNGDGKPAHANVLDGLQEIQTKTKASSYNSTENFDNLFQIDFYASFQY